MRPQITPITSSYGIQHTITDRYIVRLLGDGRECSTHGDRDVAVARCHELQERMDNERAASRERCAAREAFASSCPDLLRRTLRWQEQRDYLYSDLCRLGRCFRREQNAMRRRNADLSQPTRSAMELEELRDRYSDAVTLDTEIKNAINERNPLLWRRLLDQAERIL